MVVAYGLAFVAARPLGLLPDWDHRIALVLPLIAAAIALVTAPRPSLRDAAHARLLARFQARLARTIRLRTEVPIDGDGDRRAWDGELAVAGEIGMETCKLEAETVLHDLQALDRRIARKMRDDGVNQVVLLVADTRRNRRVMREFQTLIRERYPLSTREVMTALSSGRLPRASGCAVV